MIKLINKEETTVYTIQLTETDLLLLTGALSIALSDSESEEALRLLQELNKIR